MPGKIVTGHRGTLTVGGNHHGLDAFFLKKRFGGSKAWRHLRIERDIFFGLGLVMQNRHLKSKGIPAMSRHLDPNRLHHLLPVRMDARTPSYNAPSFAMASRTFTLGTVFRILRSQY